MFILFLTVFFPNFEQTRRASHFGKSEIHELLFIGINPLEGFPQQAEH